MNIWNPKLDIACHYSLSQVYTIQPEDFKDEPYTKYKLMCYLKYKYVPAITHQGTTLLPPIKPSCFLPQLLSFSEHAIECVRKLVIEKEKNQTKEIEAFWDAKMICPLTKTAFYCCVKDHEGHLFEKQAIEEHLKNSSNCPVGGELLASDTFRYDEYTNDLALRLLLPLLPSMRGTQAAIDEEKLDKYLKAAQEYIQNKEYNLALGMYVEICKYTDRSEDYEHIPPLFHRMDQPLKAALAYLYLARKQLSEEKEEESQISLQKAYELAPQDEIRLLQANLHLFLDKQQEAGQLFCELAKNSTEKKELLLYFEQALACCPTDTQMYETIVHYLDDDAKVRLYLIAFASFYKEDLQTALPYYEKARLLQPSNPHIYLARLLRMKKKDPERETLYCTLIDIFIDRKEAEGVLYCMQALRDEIILDRFDTLFKIAEETNSARIYYHLSLLAYSHEMLEKVSLCIARINVFDPIFSSEEKEIITLHTTTVKLAEEVDRLTERLEVLTVGLEEYTEGSAISL